MEKGILPEESVVVATGYGRVSVPYAAKCVTEITCHAKGACYIHKNENMLLIDIGGQDTKIIRIENGMVTDFLMNDKCSAGTGRFLEVMANTLSLTPQDLCELAAKGSGTSISSMCTVFAESEVISLLSTLSYKKLYHRQQDLQTDRKNAFVLLVDYAITFILRNRSENL